MLHKNLLILLLLLLIFPVLIQGSNQHERKPYIVYMGELPAARTLHAMQENHHNLLTTAIGNKQLARQFKMHSYGKSFNGFVARLLPNEAEKLLEDDNVVSVFPNTRRKLHTTRSWDFLGMPLNVRRNPAIDWSR